MRIASSLTNRIFVALTLLAALPLAFAFYVANGRASAEAEVEMRRELDEAAALVDRHRQTLSETVTSMARLIADIPRLKAAAETRHAPTVQRLAEEYLSQVNADADLLVVHDAAGAVMAAAGVDPAAIPPHAVPAAGVRVWDEQALDETSTFLAHGRGVLQLVSVPIFVGLDQSEVFGRLTLGFFMDDQRAAQFRGLTSSEIAFAADGRILASSLPAAVLPALGPVLRASAPTRVRLGDEDFIAVAVPMSQATSATRPTTVVLRSRTERLRFLTTLRAGLVSALVVTVLLATIASYAVSRTMTRPLAAVTSAMRHVSETGDLTRKVSLRSGAWDDEDARLLASAFNTLTESITRFQQEAAQKDRLSSLGRLSTVIAHEIRNPLMIIRASLSTLRAERITPEELREAADDIDIESTRLNRIVTEVLDFARPIRYDLADADLNDVCRASAAAVCAGGGAPHVALDLDAALPGAVTDAERLRAALVNLLSNARQAVERRGTGSVTVSTRQAGDRANIVVADEGAGIAPEDMPHIFDPYFTTRRAGTGLGLPIAKRIIEGLGGTIAVRSRPGAGTEIAIDLPLHATPSPGIS